MTQYHYTVAIEPDEDQYHAYVPALPGCHTFAPTLDLARDYISEAMGLYIEGLQQEGELIPVEGHAVSQTA